MQVSPSPTMHNHYMAGKNTFLSISIFSLPPSIAQAYAEFNIDLCQTLIWTYTALPTTTNVCGCPECIFIFHQQLDRPMQEFNMGLHVL